MKSINSFLLIILGLLLVIGCRDPFEPDLIDTNLSLLVVEGYIEIDGEESKITLSRSSSIDQTEIFPVNVATVSVVSSSGERSIFAGDGTGIFTYSGFFNQNETYQLSIQINENSYLSDPLTPIITPEIEELDFIQDEAGVEIFVSTKGNSQAQYFIWSYEESWIFRPAIITFDYFDRELGQVLQSPPDDRTDLCWGNNIFPQIILQNSARFSDNQILQRELIRIPPLSEKLQQRYSVEVRQRAIDQETFDFWEILRRNSDDIGGIFSPMPSLIRSNIHSVTNVNENVIGYVSMGKSAARRIYINNGDVSPWAISVPEYQSCTVYQDTIPPNQFAQSFASGQIVPARAIYSQMGALLGYRGAEVRCTDCRLRGSNQKPEFWED